MNQRPDRDIVLGEGLAPIPESLLRAHARREVLFIAGAGVSRDAKLPDFRDLVVEVYEKLDPAVHFVISKRRILLQVYDSQNRDIFSVISYDGQNPPELDAGQEAEVERFQRGEYDVVLGMLERRIEGGENARSRVRKKIGKVLRPDGLKPAPIHRNLMRLADRDGVATIITTNFDLLFEAAARNMKLPVQTYALEGIPRPTRRQEFNGVLHIHGALDRNPKRTSNLIISDRDLGEFYLRRRVVPDLIYDAARLYHLVLVGYSANDSPMRYLLNAVAADAERFSDLKERFIFVGMSEDDPVELEDWRARGITPIQYEVQGNDHSQLQRTLAQWVKFSKINENRHVDSVLKKIVKVKRTGARDEYRDLFDHFIRRSDTKERERLSKLVSRHKADMGWLNAIADVSSEEAGRAYCMGLLPLNLNARDQATVRSIVAFLEGRLKEKETIEWALGLGSGEIDIVKQRAILHLLDRPGGVDLHEPWLSAWWLIKESWKEPNANLRMLEVEVKKRLHSKGERSEALVSAIVDLVAPRLSIKAYGKWQLQFRKLPKRPKTFRDLFQATLTSGKVVDPAFLGLQELTEDEFIVSLANTLDVAVMRGMDIARRIGWEKGDLLLHRVYYVAESERDEGMHEPDEYNQGIAPSVKFLHAVVSRLTNIDRSAAFTFINRWKQTDSPIHWRLWAAMSRDSRIASASEVGDFLLHLDQEAFWDAYRHPEIAELRARRFSEFDDATQKAITKRIRNGPPSNLWPMNEEADRVEDYRLYWIVRELKRIEVAGATLPRRDKTWLKSNITRFSDLAEMNRVDKEFLDLPKAQSVATTTESPLDSLVGIDRLRVLEQTFPANQAWDWIKKGDNLERVLQDLESTPDGGAAFPRVWECFSLEHSPPAGPDQENNTRDLHTEACRVIDLLIKLPEEAISKAIKGISYWLSIWEEYIVAVPNWPVFWHRAWPLAVGTTNAMQLPNEELEQILNLPVRGFVDVFLAACLNLEERSWPFDESSDLGKMRNEVVNTSGRSRLIANYKMIESLGDFLFADKTWTKKHLIHPLLADDTKTLILWRAVGSRRELSKEVLEAIGYDIINKTKDPRLDRERHSSLASILVRESLHALWEGRDPAVPQGHIQQMIRLLDDEVRTYCAETITGFVSNPSKASDQGPGPPSPEHLFQSAVKPFLEEVWPPERSLASPGISDRLSRLPAITRGKFAEAVETIERFLVPFDCWAIIDYGLYGDDELAMIDDEAKAEALLLLLDRTIRKAENAVVPDDLGDALEQVRKVAPNLVRTPKYRRLETAALRV